MRTSKYYLIKRNNPKLLEDYIVEFSKEDRDKLRFSKRLKAEDSLLLIEKTCSKAGEKYTNLWTMNEGCPILWEKFTKKRLTYDYTGIVYPMIHENGIVVTWQQYTDHDSEVKKL